MQPGHFSQCDLTDGSGMSRANLIQNHDAAGMFKNPEFQQHSTVDKRGRKLAKRKNQEDMKKYYKLKDEVSNTLNVTCMSIRLDSVSQIRDHANKYCILATAAPGVSSIALHLDSTTMSS